MAGNVPIIYIVNNYYIHTVVVYKIETFPAKVSLLFSAFKGSKVMNIQDGLNIIETTTSKLFDINFIQYIFNLKTLSSTI